MADKDNKRKVPLEEMFYCTHVQANINIVDREEAHKYVDTHKLKVMYLKETNDGTPRRIWTILDPDGHTCGFMYTAVGTHGLKNIDSFKKDIFDFMEVRVPRNGPGAYVKDDKDNYPRTGYFLNKEE